ncbi:Os02g0702300, partial [Oryza sativa Japonica Group]
SHVHPAIVYIDFFINIFIASPCCIRDMTNQEVPSHV